MPNPFQTDPLADRLASLLNRTDAALDSDLYGGDTHPAPFAGGIPVMLITDMPLAATPDKFKAPPPTPEEEAVLAAIRNNMDRKYSDLMTATPYKAPEAFTLPDPAPAPRSLQDLFARTSDSLEIEETYSFPPCSPAPIQEHDLVFDAPQIPATIMTHTDHIPFRNTVTVGRNIVPAGVYVLRPGTVAISYAFASDSKSVTPAQHFSFPLDSRKCYVGVTDSCNSLDISGDIVDDTPHFYVIAAVEFDSAAQPIPFLCRVPVSAIEKHQPIAALFFDPATRQSPYAFEERLKGCVSSPVAPVASNVSLCPASLVEPEMLTPITSSITVTPVDALSVILPLVYTASSVNQDDMAIIRDHLAELASLEAKRQLLLNNLAGIASKYTRGNFGACES